MTALAAPAVGFIGKPVTAGVDAEAACTMMASSLAARLGSIVSAAVIDCDPAVLSVTEKMCEPASAPVNGWSAGKPAFPSLLERATVPVYPVATLL